MNAMEEEKIIRSNGDDGRYICYGFDLFLGFCDNSLDLFDFFSSWFFLACTVYTPGEHIIYFTLSVKTEE